jgi:hypothetical protein
MSDFDFKIGDLVHWIGWDNKTQEIKRQHGIIVGHDHYASFGTFLVKCLETKNTLNIQDIHLHILERANNG